MVKINRALLGAFAILLFFLSCFVSWVSLSAYLSFFELNEVIVFSWRIGFAIFGIPLSFYFSYFCFLSAIRNEYVKINNRLGEWLVKALFFGAVLALLLSIYISHDLRKQRYITCPKHTWVDPNKYVKDIALCDEG
ncbi:DUF1240 domain-containing protein [Pectobacterium cacticida]|uniref:DUF1240 domain-containing protein n=1 Tax=Pectobacterium cacticida TaxID=69221 RepID=A0ABZ2GCW7_9GAMM|nr:DUF1240 domain-containing protein [Pectobacterium cacticida]UYX06133.1 DUF1240 domain-containing protein [Pectobacterium cacticida]